MKIAVIGTGMVGRAFASRFTGLGHEVVVGTRDVEQTLACTEPDWLGNPPYAIWQQSNPGVRLATFADAAASADVVINATSGAFSLEALHAAGAGNLAGKPLIDVALPLDMSEGMPPLLSVANTDSLGEQIQRIFGEAQVVKTLTPMLADTMVDPSRLGSAHNVFLAGADAAAKETVLGLLRELGWPQDAAIDLGGIKGARGIEMYSRLFFTLSETFGDFDFSIAVVRQK
ncbi:NADPH-dependent F420 reductase [Actinoplanes couchii]|uniref:Oxidoreductase n=1 Tax=Actinoplanes couchii TaxID=403638 RepID=A0ABQ3XNU6_9ACTN|nr:NAD(P)-binding domain-containing protein [Actinoplanes couchii]MDR6318580.1 putative dinucleotide-binding enzyme [Actinoplanes couchii]GID60189.1 oxidoreductase [Actinoplanes couchii]